MNDSVMKLDDNGTWECRHVAHSGQPAPPTRLRLDSTLEFELDPRLPTSAPRRWTHCPDCGTYWRVWVNLRIAKPSIEPIAAAAASMPHRYRRAPVLDIDRVIDRVKAQLPEVGIFQNHGMWPADDEALWAFRLPNVQHNIQLESSTVQGGMCPFIVEHDGMPSSADVWNATSVDQATQMVVDYLRQKQAAAHHHPPAG